MKGLDSTTFTVIALSTFAVTYLLSMTQSAFSQDLLSFFHLALLVGFGVATWRRLTDAALSHWLFILFFVPLANIVLAICLMFAPTKGEES